MAANLCRKAETTWLAIRVEKWPYWVLKCPISVISFLYERLMFNFMTRILQESKQLSLWGKSCLELLPFLSKWILAAILQK